MRPSSQTHLLARAAPRSPSGPSAHRRRLRRMITRPFPVCVPVSAAARFGNPAPFTCQGAHASWWSRGDSNPGPPPCKGGALPAKLRPQISRPNAFPGLVAVSPRLPSPASAPFPASVGAPGLEPGTSALSGPRSNQLSYAPSKAQGVRARRCAPGELKRRRCRSAPRSPRRRRRSELTRCLFCVDSLRAGSVCAFHARFRSPAPSALLPAAPPMSPQGTTRSRRRQALVHRKIARPRDKIPRKEVIQPQLPLRLPCYDFVPITHPTLDGCLPCGLAHRLQVLPAFVT